MQDSTEDKKLSLLQTQVALVASQPVAPMPFRAQDVAHVGRLEMSWAATEPRKASETRAKSLIFFSQVKWSMGSKG